AYLRLAGMVEQVDRQRAPGLQRPEELRRGEGLVEVEDVEAVPLLVGLDLDAGERNVLAVLELEGIRGKRDVAGERPDPHRQSRQAGDADRPVTAVVLGRDLLERQEDAVYRHVPLDRGVVE